MKRTRLFLAVLLAAALLAIVMGMAGCNDKSEGDEPEVLTITDLAGRRVEVKVPARGVTAIGPGALRLVCYAGAADRVVGIENMEKQWGDMGRPYMFAYPELKDLPLIGQGGPDTSPDPEALLESGPDVIFAAYLLDASQANELQQKTGIPVVVLSYGDLGTFDQELMTSIDLVGKILGNEKRTGEVVAYIKGCQDDLEERTAGIAEEERPTVYAGGIGMKGHHGIESTQANFPPFAAIGARNVVDETGQRGSVIVDKEKLLDWDPDFIFVDESGYPMLAEDYATNPGFYEALTAVREGRVYGYLPYNWYTTNVDTALSDAYFIGKVIYPEAFQGIDAEAKADEIYEFLLGKALYKRMAEDYGGFMQLDLSGNK